MSFYIIYFTIVVTVSSKHPLLHAGRRLVFPATLSTAFGRCGQDYHSADSGSTPRGSTACSSPSGRDRPSCHAGWVFWCFMFPLLHVAFTCWGRFFPFMFSGRWDWILLFMCRGCWVRLSTPSSHVSTGLAGFTSSHTDPLVFVRGAGANSSSSHAGANGVCFSLQGPLGPAALHVLGPLGLVPTCRNAGTGSSSSHAMAAGAGSSFSCARAAGTNDLFSSGVEAAWDAPLPVTWPCLFFLCLFLRVLLWLGWPSPGGFRQL